MKLLKLLSIAALSLCLFCFSEAEAARPQNPGNQGNLQDCPDSCGNNKVNVCHFDGGENSYKTLCVSENAVDAHLANHAGDYCRKCVHDTFLENAVLLDLEPMVGEEVVQDDGVAYEVLYNVTMLEEGIVSLGAVADLITDVTCFNDTMTIEFKEVPSPDQLEFMFPELGIIVFDGNTLQGMKCDLGLVEPENRDSDPDLNSSFLMIAGVEKAEGKTVTVRGMPASFHHMFEEQDLLYQPVEDRRNLRKLGLGSFDINKSYDGSFSIPEGDDEKIQLNGYGKVNIDASSRGLRLKLKLRKQKCKRRGWFRRLRCLFDYKLEVDGGYTAGFDLSAYLKASFNAKGSSELLDGEKRYDFLSFPVYGIGYTFPKVVYSVIKKAIPGFNRSYYLGVKADIPAILKYGLEVNYDVELNAEATLSTGKKEVAWTLSGVLFGNLDSNFDVNELEPAKSSDIKFDYDYDTDIDIEIKGILFGGVEPQILIDIVGLASAGVGLLAGFDLEVEYNTDAMEPITSDSTFPVLLGKCGVCHYLQAKFEATAKEPFFRTKLLSQEPKNTLLFGDWSVEFLIAQLCLRGAEDKSCNDSCCGGGETCIPDAISNAESCCNADAAGAQCCIDSDCGNPAYYCDGDQQCVLRDCDTANAQVECCASSDCNAKTQFCVSNFCIDQGNPGFAVSWCGDDDIDLHVITPAGVEIDFRNPLDESTGGNLDKDDIPQESACWVENIVFPPGAPKGEYTYFVDSYTQVIGEDNWNVRVYLGDEEQAVQTGYGDSQRFSYTLV